MIDRMIHPCTLIFRRREMIGRPGAAELEIQAFFLDLLIESSGRFLILQFSRPRPKKHHDSSSHNTNRILPTGLLSFFLPLCPYACHPFSLKPQELSSFIQMEFSKTRPRKIWMPLLYCKQKQCQPINSMPKLRNTLIINIIKS